MRVSIQEREAEGICHTVTDEQAETLRRMRDQYPRCRFASQMRADGSRAVTTVTGMFVIDLDVEGYAIEFRDGGWRRIGRSYDPS